MSCSRVKLFIYSTLVKLSVDDLLLTLQRLNCLLGNTCEHLRTFVQKPSTRNSMYIIHTVQAQPSPQGDKPVCTHTLQYVTLWYVSHTDNAQAAAVEAENLNRLSGFFCQRRTFSVGRWMIEKKRMGWRVYSQYTHT